MEKRLVAALSGAVPGISAVKDLTAVSGGAVQETWAFDAVTATARIPLILRRARGSMRADRAYGIDLSTEADVLRLAKAGGVPVPDVTHVLKPKDDLGDGFIMERVEGDTIPRRILRDTSLHAKLVRDCGAAMAQIHGLDCSSLSTKLEARQPRERIARIRHDYDALNAPSPVFELAFCWLADNMLSDIELTLVHGDFRNGNLLVGPDGLRAVLDWEGAHIGDPHEDLGYISVPSWRFGEIDKTVGGFGAREDLFKSYEQASGRRMNPERARFWEIAFTMNWGIQCGQMADQFLTGVDPSVERGAIGRRRSETELDLLRALDPKGAADAR